MALIRLRGGREAGQPAPLPLPSAPPEWVTILGGWGDVLAALGNLKEVLRRTGTRQAGVIWFGEDPALPQFLREQGCEVGQGYLYSVPISKRELETLLKSGRALAVV